MTPAINVGNANTNVDGFVYNTIQLVMDMIFSDIARPTPASKQKYPMNAKYPPITGIGKYDTALAYTFVVVGSGDMDVCGNKRKYKE
jgi:hypothetical protein